MQLRSRRSYTLTQIPEQAVTGGKRFNRALALWLETLALVLIVIGLALLWATRQEWHKHSSSVSLIRGMSGKPLHVSGECITYNRGT